MSARIVECVPNISEGRDRAVIDQVVAAAAGVEGTTMLDVDPGAATNRTVITFAGEPEAVLESAFALIEKAAGLIDMREQTGAHPRQGATDVCPFVPVSGVTMDECVELSKRLGRRVGEELGIPTYLYEKSASSPERVKLPDIREGEYEALPDKLGREEWKPDFGPNEWNDHVARTGVTTTGARNFLIAYNVNLNTKDAGVARDIGLTIRDRGRFARNDRWKFIRDGEGKRVRQPGRLQECKATGWYIEEYDTAQVTMNLTDISVTPLHMGYEAAREEAEKVGARVTGSEIVGLVPLKAMLDAGRYFLEKQHQGLSGKGRQAKTTGLPERELIEVAVRSMGLRDVAAFDPDEKIIEYMVADRSVNLSGMTLHDFADELSTDSPAPGGGSAAALMGSLAAALDSMVANLTVKNRRHREYWEDMRRIAPAAQELKERLVKAIDDDTRAFNQMVAAMKAGEGEQEAIKGAAEVPMSVLRAIPPVVDMASELEEKGLQASVSDAGVAASAAEAAAVGAYYNVVINLEQVEDADYRSRMLEEADGLLEQVRKGAADVFGRVRDKLVSKLSGGDA
jgi:glutamate formiminotransferase/formiminotetrahydrofolate cyclodeaminase